MKVLIRRLHECGQAPRWREFEALLRECLDELGHHVTELDLDDPRPDPPETEFRIYGHRGRRDVPQAQLFYKEMHLKYLFTLDTEGWGADHSRAQAPPNLSGIDPVAAETFCTGLRDQFLTDGLSKHRQPPLASVDAGLKPYIFAPLQVPTDEVIRNHSRVGVPEFVRLVAAWAERSRHNVIFKLHPGRHFPEIADEVARYVAAGQYSFVADGNVHSLIAESRGVMAINSGTGFESLIHGKPVVSLGNSDYQWFTFRAGAVGLSGAMEYVEGYSPEQRRDAWRFIRHYCGQHGHFINERERDRSRSLFLEQLRQAAGSGLLS